MWVVPAVCAEARKAQVERECDGGRLGVRANVPAMGLLQKGAWHPYTRGRGVV
jgi:hypothetical protein